MAVTLTFSSPTSTLPVDPDAWAPIAYGAGGLVTDIDITGTGAGHYQYCRCDTTGAYKRTALGGIWQRIVRTDNIPPPNNNQMTAAYYGVWEIKHAPSDPTRGYMCFNKTVLVSNDSMATWQNTAFVPVASAQPNGPNRAYGNKMAVDPINKNVVYFGSEGSEGLRYTTNGFATADIQETNVPVPTLGGAHPTGIQILFDPYTGAAIGGRTRRIWAFSYGSACKRTDDAGATWTTITGGPTGIKRGVVATNGDLFVTDFSDKIWRWNNSGSAWIDLTASPNFRADQWTALVTHPTTPALIVVWASGGNIIWSSNAGATWDNTGVDYTLVTEDIPWHQQVFYKYLSICNVVRVPGAPNTVLLSEGVGVMVGDITSLNPAVYHTESIAIEQLCVDQQLTLPNGTLLTAMQDRGIMFHANPTVFPSSYIGYNLSGIIHCFSIDYYPKTAPTIIAGTLSKIGGIEESGYGPVNGSSWTKFTNPFAGGQPGYGNIAIGGPTNFVWVPGWDQFPVYTTNAGTSWTLCSFSPTPTNAGGFYGGGFSEFARRHTLVADPNVDGTFYVWHTVDGLYRSTNGGANWTLRVPTSAHAELIGTGGAAPLLKFIPGQTGKLLLTAGRDGNFAMPFFTLDAVAGTATPLTGITGVYQFGLGAPAPGHSVPSVIMAASPSSSILQADRAIFVTDDWFVTYKKVGDELNIRHQFDRMVTLEGDPTRYGRVYVGFSGSGGAYVTFPAT